MTSAQLLAAVQADYAALGTATFATQGAIYAKLGSDLAALQASLVAPPPPPPPPPVSGGLTSDTGNPLVSDGNNPLTGA